MTQASEDDRFVRYLYALERWARNNQQTRGIVRVGSDADTDRALAGGGGMIPTGIVESLINSATDHLMAWYEKCVTDDEPPIIRLSSYADFTLLRPAIECMANVVWITTPDDPVERVKRTLQFVNIELQHGKKLVGVLDRAGTPDAEMSQTFARAEPVLRAAAEHAGLDPERMLSSKTVDETQILRAIGAEMGGPQFETLLHWARASAHAHSQILTTLMLAERSDRKDAHGQYIYAEVSVATLSEACDLLLRLINVAVDVLNRRGYERATAEHPNVTLRPPD